MLTSSASQYLHPDYLNPLPTTLDAKKSPLALLAQTCSSIGKDTTPSKPIIPPLEKSKESQNHSGGSSSNVGRKSESPTSKTSRSSGSGDREERKSHSTHSHSGSREGEKRDGSSSPNSDSKASFRAPVPKEIPPLVPISTVGDKSRPSSSSPVNSKSGSDRDRDGTPVSSCGPSTGPSAGLQSNSRISLSCGNMLLEVNHQEAAAALAKTSLPTSHPTLGSTLPAYPGLHHSLGGYAGCLPMLGHPIAMDAATASAMHHSGLSAHTGLGLASAAAKASLAGSAISPYSYARVKSTSGATTLVPICRDPYCTNCQITMQNAQLSSGCAAGCTQCNHEKSLSVPTSLASVNTSLGTVPVLPMSSLGASHHASSLPLSSSLYHHAFSILPGHHTLPYVCNWMAGSEYCGKRFTTSEELLQHLRSHTSAGDSLASGLSAAYAGLGGLPAHLGVAACHSHYPGSLSPNSLRQAYPRSLSPNTLLAASRYHPYKSPLSSLPVAHSAALPGGLPSSLGAYYSPYALYGQRIGAAVAP